jgi:hypothetical protein
VEPTLTAEPTSFAAAQEPFVETPAARAAETFVRPSGDVFDETAFEEPVFEFAPAPELATESLVDLVAADNDAVDEETGIDEPGEDEIVIDLSEDIAEISPEASDEELFDGERIGVYTMPSFDEEFMIDDDAPIAATARVAAVEDAATELPLDIAEFDDDEIAAFAAFEPEPIVAVAKPEERVAPIVAEVVPAAVIDLPEVAPVAAQARDDGWISMGLRHVWAWPTLEGVAAESPSPLAALEEFSDVLAAAAPLPRPPVALPRPHVVPAAPKADHMEWAELIASLRQDIERRRNQPAPAPPVARPMHPAPAAVHNDLRPKRRSTPVQDEWGFFDPHQCGFAALLEKLDQITDTDDDGDGRRPA